MGWRGASGAGLIAAAAMGCAEPPPLPAPPTNRVPPIERAAECPPVGHFAHRGFEWIDIDEASGCGVFIEQDECVLAIFDDCTGPGGVTRQWEGILSVDDTITLQPFHEPAPPTSPPTRCTGKLQEPDSPGAWARLSCDGNGHAGFYLEGHDPAATPFGTVQPDRQIDIDSAQGGLFPGVTDMEIIDGPNGRELWIVDAHGPIKLDASIMIYDLATSALKAKLDLLGARRITPLAGHREVVALSAGKLIRYDVATHMRVQTTTSAHNFNLMDLSPDGTTLFVAEQTKAQDSTNIITARRPDDLDVITASSTITEALIMHFEATAPTSSITAALVIGAQTGFNTLVPNLIAMTSNLDVVWRDDPGFGLWHFENLFFIPERQRVAVVRSRLYWELDYSQPVMTFDDPIPVPFIGGLDAVAYDPDTNRAYVGGNGVVFIDFATGRAVQSRTGIAPETHVRRMLLDPMTKELFLMTPDPGKIQVITPN